MKAFKLIIALTILSLLAAPAFSTHEKKVCACTSGGCDSPHAMSCCDKIIEEPCLCQISSASGMEVYEPGDPWLISPSFYKNGRAGLAAASMSGSRDGGFSPGFPAGSEGKGPPWSEVIDYLPPSARVIFKALAFDGPMTQKDIISATGLPTRTVRYALGKLKDESVVEECFYFPDARQSLYRLKTG